ncbi:MAG: phage major capsid protein [Actinobacteria bacterium]|nr:phage major capsid protein [Actinomycetota bacterium]
MATKLSTATGAGLAAGTGGANLLPRKVATEIWRKATAASVVPTLATSTPLILGENTFPTLTKRPAASVVGENQNKPDSDLEVGSKTIKPIKAVVGLEFTMEAIMTNPAGVLGLMQEEMGGALARQVDLAVLHGRQASNGAALTGGQEFISQTANNIILGTDPNDIDDQLWEGYGLIVDGDWDFTGFAFDPRLIFTLATAKNATTNVRLHPEIKMGSAVTEYEGQPVAVSKLVSGQADASTDTTIRAFAGDWDSLKFGYVLDIGVRKIEYGDPFGNGDLQRRNSVAYMAEVIFGWAIRDLDAFVSYSTTDLTP